MVAAEGFFFAAKWRRRIVRPAVAAKQSGLLGVMGEEGGRWGQRGVMVMTMCMMLMSIVIAMLKVMMPSEMGR